MKALLVALACGGLVLILTNHIVNARHKTRVEYRYLPRDLDTYMREAPFASVEFDRMFVGDDVMRN